MISFAVFGEFLDAGQPHGHHPRLQAACLCAYAVTSSTPTMVRECPLCWKYRGGLPGLRDLSMINQIHDRFHADPKKKTTSGGHEFYKFQPLSRVQTTCTPQEVEYTLIPICAKRADPRQSPPPTSPIASHLEKF